MLQDVTRLDPKHLFPPTFSPLLDKGAISIVCVCVIFVCFNFQNVRVKEVRSIIRISNIVVV